MKAKVYGYAICGCIEDWKRMNGEILDVFTETTSGDYYFNDDSYKWFVHEKQIEPIKEITITEEDFDEAVRNSVVRRLADTANPRSFEIYIKEELFKDVK